jgi:hypothetical protein
LCFYQDRLGTNIGKVEKKKGRRASSFVRRKALGFEGDNEEALLSCLGDQKATLPLLMDTLTVANTRPNPKQLVLLRRSEDAEVEVRKRHLFEPFMHKNAHFTKTGSGQT